MSSKKILCALTSICHWVIKFCNMWITKRNVTLWLLAVFNWARWICTEATWIHATSIIMAGSATKIKIGAVNLITIPMSLIELFTKKKLDFVWTGLGKQKNNSDYKIFSFCAWTSICHWVIKFRNIWIMKQDVTIWLPTIFNWARLICTEATWIHGTSAIMACSATEIKTKVITIPKLLIDICHQKIFASSCANRITKTKNWW